MSGTSAMNQSTLFNSTQLIEKLEDEFGTASVIVLALTVVNFFAAVLTIILVLGDNINIHKTWKLDALRRIPFSIALAVAVSHLFFMLKALNGIAWLRELNSGGALMTLACK